MGLEISFPQLMDVGPTCTVFGGGIRQKHLVHPGIPLFGRQLGSIHFLGQTRIAGDMISLKQYIGTGALTNPSNNIFIFDMRSVNMKNDQVRLEGPGFDYRNSMAVGVTWAAERLAIAYLDASASADGTGVAS